MARPYTVIIPTLNAAKTLKRQIEAVFGQSMPPEEVIVVDSQSDDGTGDFRRLTSRCSPRMPCRRT